MFSEAARALLEGPRIAHVVTINADGSPQVSAVWVGLDGDDRIGLGTQRTNTKVRNIRRDPRVALSIEGDPGGFLQPYLVVHGTADVDDVEPAVWLERMDALAAVYTGKPFPMRSGGDGVWVTITPERLGGAGM